MEKKNAVIQLKAFFGTPDRHVSANEMMTFWKSLSDEEKAFYLAADLA